MRIPFPVRIPLFYVTCFAAALLGIQLYQGTSPEFAIFSFLFIVVAGITFNVAGGFSRTSGTYVFSYAVLAVILGLCWKAVLGEPADSNLKNPVLTMQAYLGSIVAMLMAVIISKKLTPQRPLLGGLLKETTIQNATIGCLVVGIAVTFLLYVTPSSEGSILSALGQVNRFLPVALILGVMHAVRSSGGRKSMNTTALIAAVVSFASGLVSFSKEGIFMPFACWFIAAASQGYRPSKGRIAGLIVMFYLMVHYLVPYSQYGRNFREDTTLFERAVLARDFLGDLGRIRTDYEQSSQEYEDTPIQAYFNTPQGFMDRLQMISMDDGLISVTEERGPIGSYPLLMGFANLVPRFLWPNKPAVNFGNYYAHEMGMLAPDDFTTGISFSPTGEAYHIAKWFGVFFWAPLLWILLFVIFDTLCGDTRSSPWGLVVCAYFAHLAPEGALMGVIYSYVYVTAGIIFAALSAAYVMPILGTLIKGPEKATMRRGAVVRSIPRHTGPLRLNRP